MSDVVIVVKWILMWTQQLVTVKIMKTWWNNVTCLIWNPCLGSCCCITSKIRRVCRLLQYLSHCMHFTFGPVVTGRSNFETLTPTHQFGPIKTPSYMVRTVSCNIWDIWSPYLSPQTDHLNWGFMIFFGGTCCLHLQGGRWRQADTSEVFVSVYSTTWCYIPEDTNVKRKGHKIVWKQNRLSVIYVSVQARQSF